MLYNIRDKNRSLAFLDELVNDESGPLMNFFELYWAYRPFENSPSIPFLLFKYLSYPIMRFIEAFGNAQIGNLMDIFHLLSFRLF